MIAPTTRRSRIYYGWWIVLAGFVTLAVTFGLKTYVFAVFVKPMTEDLGWSRGAVSLAFTIITISGGLISPLVGRLVDSRGPRLSVVIGALIGGTTLVFVGFVDQLWQWFLVFGVLYAVGETMMGAVPINTAITNWFLRKRGAAMGLVYASVGFGALVLVPTTSVIVERYGWRTAWITLGVLVLVTIAPVGGLLMRRRPEDMGLLPDGAVEVAARGRTDEPDSVGEPSSGDWTLGEAIRTRAFWLVALIIAAGGTGSIVFTVHGFAFASDLGFSSGVVATAVSLSLIIGTPSRFLYGWLCDRTDIRRVVMLYCSGLLIANILLAQTRSLTMLYIAVIIYGSSVGGLLPVPASFAAKLFGRTSMGRIFGTLNLIGMFVVALGAPAAGYIYDITGSYSLAFWAAAAGLVLGVGAGLLARPPKRKEARSILLQRA